MRFIALDGRRDFCEVAIKDESGLRLAGEVRTAVAELERLAQSLAPDDQVALEASEPALQIARIVEPHVGSVAIANTRKLRAIAESKVKADKLEASTLCEQCLGDNVNIDWAHVSRSRRRLCRPGGSGGARSFPGVLSDFDGRARSRYRSVLRPPRFPGRVCSSPGRSASPSCFLRWQRRRSCRRG